MFLLRAEQAIDLRGDKASQRKQALAAIRRPPGAVLAESALPGPGVAKLLVDAGFLTTEGIAEAELTDLVDIEGLDEALAQQIKDKVSA